MVLPVAQEGQVAAADDMLLLPMVELGHLVRVLAAALEQLQLQILIDLVAAEAQVLQAPMALRRVTVATVLLLLYLAPLL